MLLRRSATPPLPVEPEPPGLRLTVLGVMAVLLLGMLDNAVVATAMPSVVRELGGLDSTSWVVTAYTLAVAVTAPVWGKGGDLIGRKRVFLAAVVVFLAGSALSGAAPSMGALIGARIVQGLGAGGLAVGAMSIVATLVPPRRRGRYQGLSAAVVALGTLGGPLLGGAVTEHLGWRAAFLINLPVGLVALLWCGARLHLPARRAPVRIDGLGAVLLGLALSGLVLAASWAGVRFPPASPVILGLLAVAAASLAGFVTWERRHPEPLLPPRIFAQRNYRLAVGIVGLAGIIMFAATIYLPLYWQAVRGASPQHAGLLTLPMMLALLACSQTAGRIMTRTGRYKLFPVLGGVLLTTAALLLAGLGEHAPAVVLVLGSMLLGAGSGLTMQMCGTIAQNSVEVGDLGSAVAGVSLVQTAGGSAGLAVFGAVLARATGFVDRPAPAQVLAALHRIFLLAGGAAALLVVAAALLVEVPLRATNAATPTPAAPGSRP